MIKDMHKAIWNRSRFFFARRFCAIKQKLRGKNTKKNDIFLVISYKKPKKDHFAKLDISSVIDNKSFWQTVQPFSSSKVKSYRNVNLLKKQDDTKLVDDDEKIAKIFTERFVNIVQKLGIVTKKSNIKLIKLNLDEVDMAVNKYKTIYVEVIKNRMLELGNPTLSFDLFAVKRWLWSQKYSNLGQTYEIFH